MNRKLTILILLVGLAILGIGVYPYIKPQEQFVEAHRPQPDKYRSIQIPKGNYSKAKWDNYGPGFDGESHIWMSRAGSISYTLAIGKTLLIGDVVEVSVKTSSELRDKSTDMTFSSDVTLFVNGVEQSTLNVIPDNGVGQDQTWKVPKDVFKPDEQNEITFVVKKEAFYKNGICFYSPIELKFKQ
jgi:hypothetical protein